MTDLHTHILPGMDDGAPHTQISLDMLRMQREQGVQGVALTPHFYRDEERPEGFFRRREESWLRLREGMERAGEQFPRLTLGAEVAWVPGMHRWEELERFRLGASPYLLVELPDTPWRNSMFDQLYELMDSRDVIPVIAHVDRYLRRQRADRLNELRRMGVPLQVSAEPLLHLLQRGPVLRWLEETDNCCLISDCHSLTGRPPNMGPGMARLERSLSPDRLAGMVATGRRIFERAVEKEGEYASK